MSIDQRSFRKALGCFASGMTVVTTTDPETKAPVGVTVSAFSSVSLDPPLVLFCLAKQTSTLNAFRTNGYFAVNILAEAQRDVSIRFASRSDDKWVGVKAETWTSGVPVLPDCVANLECKVAAIHDGGDHLIFVGEVIKLKSRESGSPLVYFRGAYMDPCTVPGGDL